MDTYEKARIEDKLTRAETAKIISIYAKKFLDKKEDTTKHLCTQFTDIKEVNTELQ